MGAALSEPMEFRGECSLTVLDASQLLAVCRHARDELGFDMLTDLSSVDHYGSDPRFEVVYELYGMSHHTYLRLKIAQWMRKPAKCPRSLPSGALPIGMSVRFTT